MGDKKTTVLLVDHETIVRQGLRALLDTIPDIQVVGEAENGRQAVTLVCSLKPHVVVTEVVIPKRYGINSTQEILSLTKNARVIALSAHVEDEKVAQLIEAGAVGYLDKQGCCFFDVVRAIREAKKGNCFFSPSISKRLLEQCRSVFGGSMKRSTGPLTSLETDVLRCVAQGGSIKQISNLLGISTRTVGKYRRSIMDKLNTHATAGLTRYAVAKGIVKKTLHPPPFRRRLTSRDHNDIVPVRSEKARRRKGTDELTRREIEILELLGSSYSSKQIGDVLGIAMRTVKRITKRIMAKLKIHAIPDLIQYGIVNPVIKEPRP